MRQIKIGLVGCGNWGKIILRDLVSLNCQVTVVARSEATRKNAKAGGAHKVVSETEKLPKLDGYMVATPSTTHAHVINKLLDLFPGTAIFTEKPMTTNYKHARDIYKRAPKHIFVMDKWRYHPGIQELAKIAKKKVLGKVVGLECIRVGWGNPHDDTDSIWHLLSHDISIVLEVLDTIPKSIAARADIVNQQPTGLTAILGTSPWVHIQVSSRHPNRKREFMLLCQNGVVILPDPYSNHLLIAKSKNLKFKNDPKTEKLSISTEMPLSMEIKTFIKHINGGPPPKSNAKEGLEIVKTITKLRQLAGIK